MQGDKHSYEAAHMIEGAEVPRSDRGTSHRRHPKAAARAPTLTFGLLCLGFFPVMSLPALKVCVCAKVLPAQILRFFVHDLN